MSTDTIYTYNILEAGEVKPTGWIMDQLKRDLNEGYIGRFDEINSTVDRDLFVKQERKSRKRYNWLRSWWSGEHEGYWKDAITRMAFLTGDKNHMEQARNWMNSLLENIDSSGYIGIYDDCEEPNCRFNHTGENGELWATSRIMMAMLAYYEYTGDKKILDAVEKGTQLFMKVYSEKNYFANKARGGQSHGIGFFEVLEWLYRITGKKAYNDFANKLYHDFCEGRVRDDDLMQHRLLDEKRFFRKHGAHIAEGFFMPFYLEKINPGPKYQLAAAIAMRKLDFHITPGGAMRCDEWIKGRKGTADERYEYCGITELISPLNKIIAFTGDLSVADRIELMTFNAGQGARFPVLKGLSYLTSDNRISINHQAIGRRESYDANHFAAACCVLNGGRLMPYYIEGMWMKDEHNEGLLASLYGPNELTTTIRNKEISIKEKTNYPFSDNIVFTIQADDPVTFPLSLRKPYGADDITVRGLPKEEISHYKDRVVITREWSGQEEFEIVFHFKVEYVPQPSSATVPNGGFYIKRGPLVFALPFDHKITEVKEHKNSGFYRYHLKASNKEGWNYKISEEPRFNMVRFNDESETLTHPWDEPVVGMKGSLIDGKGSDVEVQLVPMGNTVFRRVTFPYHRKKE